jgi:hypothetical protein
MTICPSQMCGFSESGTTTTVELIVHGTCQFGEEAGVRRGNKMARSSPH